MQPPKYVWITPGWYGRQWWARDFGNTSCSVETIEGMLVHSLTFNPSGNLVSDDTDVVTFSGLVGNITIISNVVIYSYSFLD